MEVSREQIEKEENYKELQSIGKAFREDGHELVLNAPEDELKVRLLVIFDESYAKSDETEEADESVELGAENAPEDEAEPQEDEEEDSNKEEEEEEKEESEAIGEGIVEELEEELEIEEEEEEGEKLYYSHKRYKDWESKWETSRNNPQPLPEKLTAGLKNSLKTGRIIEYNG